MQPYDETLVLRTNDKVQATYAEALRSPDEQYPVWIARTVYDYCGGLSWDASEAKHLRECRQALGLDPLPAPSSRQGVVTLDGRMMRDDAGPWLALGASYFPLLSLMRDDPTRATDNLQWLGERGVDFVRVFADVSGPTWADRSISFNEPNWSDIAARAIETARACGLRIAWTLFAGPHMEHDSGWYKAATRTWLALVEDCLDSVQYPEVRNEGEGCDEPTMRDCARLVRERYPKMGVALCGTPEKGLPIIYNGSAASLATVHWDRRYEERGWRPVRQPWGYYDLATMPSAHVDNEPIGIDSSIAAESDPVRLSGAAITAWLTGECAYVLHHGAGIRAGGAADLARGRKANCWEQPTLEPTLAMIAQARALLPPDLPSWDRHGHTWPTHPLTIVTAVGDPVEQNHVAGCNRCYAMTRGDRAVVFVAGIYERFEATSKGGAFEVWRLLDSGAVVSTMTTVAFSLTESTGRAALLIR